MKLKPLPLVMLFCLVPFSPAMASGGLDSGATAWMMVSTALVMIMTPAGLALFYGGMCRYKNLLNTLAMTFVSYCLASVIWVIWGYSLAFGPDKAGLIGAPAHLLLAGINVNSLTGSIPTYVFVMFQMTFAGITVALVLGAIVDRMKFSAWIVFTVLWLTCIYAPIAHWVWGGGWMSKMGALDFAGGNVVHINAGVAGLVAITPAAGYVNLTAALVIGMVAGLLGFYSVTAIKPRLGYDDSLDAFGVHGICGIWGALATGLFANPAVNASAAGLFYGNPGQLAIQAISIAATAGFTALGTLAVILLTRLITGGLRVQPENEIEGLDSSVHGERAFELQ